MADPQPRDERERAQAGFTAWLGAEPDEQFEVASPPGAAEGPPVRVLFFVDEGDEDQDDEPTTYIATAGLSSRSLSWSPGGVELLLCITGDFDFEELEPLGQLLGHLAMALQNVETEAVPGLLLEVGPLPVFEGMTSLLLTRWGQSDDSGVLATEPPTRILSVNVLYEEEAAEIVKLSEEQALEWLDEHGIDVDDPLRDSAFASEFAAVSEKTLAAFQGDSSFEIASAMQQLSGSMASWINAAAPGFLEQFASTMPRPADPDAPPPSSPRGKPGK